MGTPPREGSDQKRPPAADPVASPDPVEGAQPAEDAHGRSLRRLRRWVAVAVSLALIGIGAAVFALFTGDLDDEDTASAKDVARLSDQVDAAGEQLDSLTEAQDEQAAEVNRVSTRLDEVDQALSEVRASTREPPEELQSLSTDVRSLEARIDDLESGNGDTGADGG
jgi:septal ring factor EnvC (AmiA/AmiB activator)